MGTHRARQVVELRPDQRAEKGHGSQKVEVVLGEAPPVLHGNALGDVADVEHLLVVLAVDRLGAARLAGHLGHFVPVGSARLRDGPQAKPYRQIFCKVVN